MEIPAATAADGILAPEVNPDIPSASNKVFEAFTVFGNFVITATDYCNISQHNDAEDVNANSYA